MPHHTHTIHTDSDKHTGTFILLDSMLERIKGKRTGKRTVNVYAFLMGLRKKKVLVQTLVGPIPFLP